VATAQTAVQQYSAGGYVNYREMNQSASRYFAGNLARLRAVREKCDLGQIMFSGLGF
jgi:hypothetical protein